MKLCFIFFCILFISLGKASNICYGNTDIPCTCLGGCFAGFEGTLAEILRVSPTMDNVWLASINTFGGLWTVVQTPNANWYSNWGTAGTCTCNGTVNIFVRQAD